MRPRGCPAVLVIIFAIASGALGCAGDPEAPANGGSGGAGGAGGSAGTVGLQSPLLPARIRRLTNAEYDASVRALLGTSTTMAATFPPDARQGIFSRGGYTLNDAQRVDPVLAKQLGDAAVTLIAEARANGRLSNLAPCANPASGGEACASTFIKSFGAKAYRRPITTDETSALLAIYRAGATGGTYADGIDMVVRGALQSAGFLYITEIGDGGKAPATSYVTLTPYEAASVLAYTLTGSPPDDTLMAMAAAGGLVDGAAREQQARRLLALPSGQDAMIRFVREMFSLDQIAITDKDSTAYPAFAGLKNAVVAESTDFVREVLVRSTGSIGELLSADWTIADSALAGLYGGVSAGNGRTSLASLGRRGLLNRAAFLSVFAHASESAPVLRGVAIMRQVACMPLGSPTELNINVTPPPVDPKKTTRERFAAHVSDPKCAACHTNIDAFGFTFETFDGMGAARPVASGHPTENGLAVDTSSVVMGTDFDGSFANSDQLAMAMAGSVQVRTCLARQIFRSSAGRSDNTVKGSENAFVEVWKQLPADQQGNILETLVAFVKNPTFMTRRPQ